MSSEAQTDEDDRIEQLEARVEELEAQDSLTSGTVPISRRGLLQGGVALGIGALGGSVLSDGESGRVAAQTAAGQVGTDSSRVDVYGNLVDAASVNADSADIGSGAIDEPSIGNSAPATVPERPMISNSPTEVHVDPDNGSDSATGASDDPVATIQEAINRCPLFLRHEFIINLIGGDGSPDSPRFDEDLIIPPVISSDSEYIVSGDAGQESAALKIRGSNGYDHNYTIGSLYVLGAVGKSNPSITGVRFTRGTPHDEGDDAAVFLNGCESASIGQCGFRGEFRVCSTVYTGCGMIDGCEAYNDYGNGIDYGITGKRSGTAWVRGLSGTVNSQVLRTNRGFIEAENVSASAVDSRFMTNTHVIGYIRVGSFLHQTNGRIDVNPGDWGGVTVKNEGGSERILRIDSNDSVIVQDPYTDL